MRRLTNEDWNFAVWIAAIHAALQASAMGGAAYASRTGAGATAGILDLLDTILTFPFVAAWRATGLDAFDAWFFVPRAPAAIAWGTAVAWATRRSRAAGPPRGEV